MGWICAWGFDPMDYSRFPIDAGSKTQCALVLNNISGARARLRLSNRCGAAPLTLESVALCQADSFAAIRMEDCVPVRLGGKEKIVLAPGDEVWSDPADIPLRAGKHVAILCYPGAAQAVTTACSCYPQALTRVGLWRGAPADGLFSLPPGRADTALHDLEREHECFYGACALEVWSDHDARALACFGDSITHRALWTAPLALRLYRAFPDRVSLVNHGISGNRMLSDASPFSPFGPWFGGAGVERFEKDVFGGAPVEAVTVLQGINDIFHTLSGDAPMSQDVSADQLIGAHRRLIGVVHAHSAKAIGCTVTPFDNAFSFWCPYAEEKRAALNRWMRASGEYDAIVDFDEMIRVPDAPTRMAPEYDSGDNIHPGPLGGERMAQGFSMAALGRLLGIEESPREE